MALSSRASSRSQRKLPLSVAALGFLGGPTAHLTTTPQLPAPSTCSFLLSKGPLFSRPGGLKETRDSPSGGQHFRCYRVTYTPPHIFLLTSYMLPRFADLKSKPYTLPREEGHRGRRGGLAPLSSGKELTYWGKNAVLITFASFSIGQILSFRHFNL